MLIGPMVRKRKNHKQYDRYAAAKTPGCDFCAFTNEAEQVTEEHGHFWIVTNLFGYDTWDGLNVLEHLMIVPKRHVDSIGHFEAEESLQYMKVLSEYEARGYSVYARAPRSKAKSVTHQHTHLIKLGNKHTKAMIYLRKPHYLGYL